MSYSFTNINNKSSSNITLNLSDVTQSGTPSNNDVINFNGSSWQNSNIPSSLTSDLSLKFGLFGSTNLSWGTGIYLYEVGDYLLARRHESYNFTASNFTWNNATSTNSVISNSKWFESIDIPEAGRYLCMYSVHADRESGTAASATYRWQCNAGYFGSKCYVDSLGQNYGGIATGIVDAVQNDILRLVVVATDSAGQGSGSLDLHHATTQKSMCTTIIKIG
jgi:hypothetical protein